MESRNIAKEIAAVAQNYNYQEPPFLLVKLQELMSALMRVLRDLLNMLRIPSPADSDTRLVGNLIQGLLIVAATAAIIIVILLIARRLSHLETQRKLAQGGIIVGESQLDAGGWRQLATRLSQTGSYREACRALYMSCLHNMDENKIAVFAPTKTNYEYIYSLKKWPKIVGHFRSLVDAVELIWFGGKAANAQDYQLSLSLLTQLEAAIEQAALDLAAKNGVMATGAASDEVKPGL